jgi:hypothetical protein
MPVLRYGPSVIRTGAIVKLRSCSSDMPGFPFPAFLLEGTLVVIARSPSRDCSTRIVETAHRAEPGQGSFGVGCSGDHRRRVVDVRRIVIRRGVR